MCLNPADFVLEAHAQNTHSTLTLSTCSSVREKSKVTKNGVTRTCGKRGNGNRGMGKRGNGNRGNGNRGRGGSPLRLLQKVRHDELEFGLVSQGAVRESEPRGTNVRVLFKADTPLVVVAQGSETNQVSS